MDASMNGWMDELIFLKRVGHNGHNKLVAVTTNLS